MVARDGQEGRFAYFFAFGSYPGEPPHQRGRRRILVGTWWIAAAAISIRAVFEWVGGFPLLGLTSGLSAGAVLAALLAIRRWPRRFPWVLNGLLTAWSLTTLAQTTLLGGLESSGLAAMWGLTGVLAALIGLSVRAAAAWLVAFLAQVWFALWGTHRDRAALRGRGSHRQYRLHPGGRGYSLLCCDGVFRPPARRVPGTVGSTAQERPARRKSPPDSSWMTTILPTILSKRRFSLPTWSDSHQCRQG